VTEHLDSQHTLPFELESVPAAETDDMKPKISIVTLGVRDLAEARAFYGEGLGLPMQEADEDADIAFFELEGAWLALYPREALADDAGVEPGEAPSGFPNFTIAHNVPSEAAVDGVLDEAVAAGARLVKSAEKAHWGGYSGYFADPDGFLWEVAYNPFTDLT